MKFLNLLILIILAMSINGHAARVYDDTLTIGKEGSSDNKEINLGSRKIRSNESTGKLEFSNDSGSIWKGVGSGAGGSGALNLLDNGGFEDGVDSGWEYTSGKVSAVTGSTVLDGDTSASFDPTAQNDYLRTVYKTIKAGITGNACEARFRYKGGDAANYSAVVELESGAKTWAYRNKDGNNILPIHSVAGYESIFFPCPTDADIVSLSTNGNARLRIYQGTVTDATAMLVDDVHIGGLIGLVETALPDEFGATISGTGTITNENGVDWIDGNCSVSSPQRTCLLKDLGLTQSLTCTASANLATGNIVVDVQHNLSGGGGTLLFYVTLGSTGAGNTASSVDVHCKKSGADAKQSVQVYKSIPKISELKNTFSAWVTSAGTVVTENYDFINGNCAVTNTSAYTCSFNSSLFSAAPVCVISQRNATGGTIIYSEMVTTTTTEAVANLYTNGARAANDLFISCDRQNTDVKAETVQPVILGQVTNSTSEGSALTNVRVESCRVVNGGAAVIDTQTGLCGWVSSVNRTATGRIVWTILAGVFSANPSCSVNSLNATLDAQFEGSPSSTSVITRTTTTGGSDADIDVFLTCVGKR